MFNPLSPPAPHPPAAAAAFTDAYALSALPQMVSDFLLRFLPCELQAVYTVTLIVSSVCADPRKS